MHLPCVAKYFQSSAEPHCPHCNDYWPHEVPGLCLQAARFPPGLTELGWQGCVCARVSVPSPEGAPGWGLDRAPQQGLHTEVWTVRNPGPAY